MSSFKMKTKILGTSSLHKI